MDFRTAYPARVKKTQHPADAGMVAVEWHCGRCGYCLPMGLTFIDGQPTSDGISLPAGYVLDEHGVIRPSRNLRRRYGHQRRRMEGEEAARLAARLRLSGPRRTLSRATADGWQSRSVPLPARIECLRCHAVARLDPPD